MINDYRQTAFLYDQGTHYKSRFYSPTGHDYNEEYNFRTDTELIASNVDKAGNRFDMVIRYESEWEDNNGEREKLIHTVAVEILKNGESVRSVELQKMANEVFAACPDTEIIWAAEHGEYTESINAFWSRLDEPEVSGAFIEDENTWSFWVHMFCSKETLLDDDVDLTYEMTGTITTIDGIGYTALTRYYLVTPSGQTIVSEDGSSWDEYAENYELAYRCIASSTNTIPSIKMPLQDGYYCVIHDLFYTLNDMDNQDRYARFVNLIREQAYITFYTPNGQEIFTGLFRIGQTFPICRVKGKYLLHVKESVAFGGPILTTYDNLQVFFNGLWFGAGNQWEVLSTITAINQRLRPMKKIRNWQNNLQLIELAQHEI